MFFNYRPFSLQATWIQNTLLQALRQGGASVTTVPKNFAYSVPSITGLAKFISATVTSPSQDPRTLLERNDEALHEMVAKYTLDFPSHFPTAAASTSEVALLTGSTGGLGSAILAHMVTLPSVYRIYAWNRRSKDGRTIRERQLEALRDRGLDTTIVDSTKVVFVEGDTSTPDLGISKEQFAEVAPFTRQLNRKYSFLHI